MFILEKKVQSTWVEIDAQDKKEKLPNVGKLTPGEYRITEVKNNFRTDTLEAWCQELVSKFKGGPSEQWELAGIILKIEEKLNTK